MDFGKKLRILLAYSGKQQYELAEEIGTTRVSVNRWMHNVALPSSENLHALSKYFGVSFGSLIDENVEAVIVFKEKDDEA